MGRAAESCGSDLKGEEAGGSPVEEAVKKEPATSSSSGTGSGWRKKQPHPNVGKYWAIAAAPCGRLYAPPYNAERVLEVDGEKGVASEIGRKLPSAVRKYQVIAAGPHGRLYAPPANANWCLEVDPATRSVSFVGPEVPGGWKKYVA